eukprot:TRINITY_DN847_c0_g1_i1.p1 TRINITY_DN847_c0_g1~~TRINITY_DN847_c0_g1_i1.p1  ORF type:complete len:337 (+),score=127.21 TRINITY_DN847_c0_g1_i1:43-1011(+)
MSKLNIFKQKLNPLNPDQEEWYLEPISKDILIGHSVKEKLFEGRSKFQDVAICRLGGFDKCLLLDDHMQSSESDEFIYHESLVHPAMLVHPNPKNVYILGGGEGATLREILRHQSVEKVVMVDIDGDVVEMCKKHLPSYSQGSFDDPRVQLVVDDARGWLERTDMKFDVIISDLCDPVEEGPAYLCYTQKFYETMKTKMNEGAILAVQSGPLGFKEDLQDSLSPIYQTLSKAFKTVRPYFSYIHSFNYPNAYTFASDFHDLRNITADEINDRIEKRIKGGHNVLRFYDGYVHLSFQHLPKYLRKKLEDCKIVITEENPFYCF